MSLVKSYVLQCPTCIEFTRVVGLSNANKLLSNYGITIMIQGCY
jgi:hypothetical protein